MDAILSGMKKELTPQEYGRQGGKKSRAMMSDKQWKEHCSRAAQIGWMKRKNPRGVDGKFVKMRKCAAHVTKSEILICGCGEKYIKARNPQETCVPCMFRK